ncbi:GreA/GreB family elongation factor [Nannocystis sp. SCPEA4]|uniref:GreA/GreB family elongation factor n=1 Tax=Nannocystis sp. SCPEA4 TaxID=2996787 RepID=UPI0022708D38|nr:GreA/GreB family elongation factor [Nannocystis sp. SCPEA4]MCY1058734.1 GreA/GreB family elongation factor [Nannocystis sp. SCPEA4]
MNLHPPHRHLADELRASGWWHWGARSSGTSSTAQVMATSGSAQKPANTWLMSGSKIQFGAKVKLRRIDSGEEQTVQIVGPEEADPKQDRISVASPLARALLEHGVGDEVKVQMQSGSRTYEVLDISY